MGTIVVVDTCGRGLSLLLFTQMRAGTEFVVVDTDEGGD